MSFILEDLRPTGGHEPTEETRKLARNWADVGMTNALIARELRLDVRELEHHYAEELAGGETRGVAKVAVALYEKALSGDVAAAVHYLKVKGRRAGWVDREEEAQRDHAAGIATIREIMTAYQALKSAGVGIALPSSNHELASARRVIDHHPKAADDGRDLL